MVIAILLIFIQATIFTYERELQNKRWEMLKEYLEVKELKIPLKQLKVSVKLLNNFSNLVCSKYVIKDTEWENDLNDYTLCQTEEDVGKVDTILIKKE